MKKKGKKRKKVKKLKYSDADILFLNAQRYRKVDEQLRGCDMFFEDEQLEIDDSEDMD